MAITFSSNCAAYLVAADWLDNLTAFSWAVWVRPDTISAGVRQYVWSHYGATNRISLRKNNAATEYWRFAVVAGGVSATVDDDTSAVTASTVYHLAGSWQNNSSQGMTIYRNGVLVDWAATTSQTAAYDSGGSVDLYVGSRVYNSEYGICTVEGLTIWPGVVLTATQIWGLYWSGWPHLIGAARPGGCWPMTGASATTIQDVSGSSRALGIRVGTPSLTSSPIGRWEDPCQPSGAYGVISAVAGPPTPNPWTFWGRVYAPTCTETVTGVEDGTTYEVQISAEDSSVQEGARSDIVEVTPRAVSIRHTPRKRLGAG